MPGPYNLVINIQPSEYAASLKLKRLYISRKVNERYTVIWSSSAVQPVNNFSWNDDFEVFAMDRFTDGEKVVPNGTKKIWKGQVLTFNKDGSTKITKDVDPEVQDRIQIRNNLLPIWSGLSGALYSGTPAPPTSEPPKDEEPPQKPVSSPPTSPDRMTGIPLNLLPKEGGSEATNKTDAKDAKIPQQSDALPVAVTDLSSQMATLMLNQTPKLEGVTGTVTVNPPAGTLNATLGLSSSGLAAAAGTAKTTTGADANASTSKTSTGANADATAGSSKTSTGAEAGAGASKTSTAADAKADPLKASTGNDADATTAEAGAGTSKTSTGAGAGAGTSKTSTAADAKADPLKTSTGNDTDVDAGTSKTSTGAEAGAGTSKTPTGTDAGAVAGSSKTPTGADTDAGTLKASAGADTGSKTSTSTDADAGTSKTSTGTEAGAGTSKLSTGADAAASKNPLPASTPVKIPSETGALKPEAAKLDALATPALTPKATPFFLARYGMISGAKSTLIPSSKVMVWIADAPVPPAPDQAGETFTQASGVAEIDVSAGVAALVNLSGVWSTGKFLDWEDGKFVTGTPLPEI